MQGRKSFTDGELFVTSFHTFILAHYSLETATASDGLFSLGDYCDARPQLLVRPRNIWDILIGLAAYCPY